MTSAQRSATMSRIRSRNTRCERTLRSALHRRGHRFRLHRKGLPGRPDILFPRQKVAIFVDGDFWHGWQFDAWKHKLAPFWREKIVRNIERDAIQLVALEESGWTVVRVWEHEIENDLTGCVSRIEERLSLGVDKRPRTRLRRP